ncbi:hypothetical protein PN462_07560 [Spirulina sp. CS-785/01]|uniref:hypothetical protein n=1 Tax=Spirulina sp. CS-785/01 TaxID=3021716 RepID=UPI00232D2646|nr:hypothetical protein [Spirulina sp. CS-785/01]MDB9312953.1 hypothetical protein [Spirulina sp. CS-785/01]
MKSEGKQSNYASVITKIALLFTTYTVVVALLFLYFRQEDAEVFRQVTGVIIYPLTLFGLVALSSHYWQNRWVLPLCVLAFMSLPFAIAPLGVWSLPPVAIAGIGAIAYSCWRMKIFKSICELIGIFFAGIALAGFYFLVVNGMNYAHLFSDIAAYANILHRDTLFHSAIINMIARFGIPSTGLDGVVPLTYHVLIHRWVAANSLMLGGDTPILLAITQQVALLPVLFFVIILTVYNLSDGHASVLNITMFAFGFIWLGSAGFSSYLASESYAFSLPIFIAMVPIGITWLEFSLSQRITRVIKPWEWAIIIPAIAACWLAKMSTGLMLVIYLCACIFIPKVLKYPKRYLFKLIPIMLLGGLSLYIFKQNTLSFPFPFHFFYYPTFYRQSFLAQVRVFFWLVLAIWLTSNSKNKLFQHSLVYVLIFTFVSSQVPGLLFALLSGAAYFIMPVLVMIAVICAAHVLDLFYTPQFQSIVVTIDWKKRKQQKINLLENQWKYIKRTIIYIVLIAILITNLRSGYLSLIRNSYGLFSRIDNFYVHRTIDSRVIGIREGTKNLMSPKIYDKKTVINRTELGKIKQLVLNLELNSTNQNTVLYIAPSYEAFWQPDENTGSVCWAQPFAISAMTGLPLLNGVRSGLENCTPTSYYGMVNYGSESLNQELSQQELCTKAKKLGFSQVYKISESRQELYRCQS